MEQADQIMLCGALFHNGHSQLIVIAGGIGIGINGSQFMLTGGALVVLGLAQNTQPPQLLIQILHE